MLNPLTPPKQHRKGRRRGVNVLIGLLLIGAGLLVFRYSSLIADSFGNYISPPQSNDTVTGMAAGVWYLPFAVWGFGVSLIGLGANMLRMSLMGAMMGSSMPGGMGGGSSMSPEMLDSYMQQAMSAGRTMAAQPAATAAAAPAKEVVKVKCRNCGSLEAEDAMFCRKCGKAL